MAILEIEHQEVHHLNSLKNIDPGNSRDTKEKSQGYSVETVSI